MWESNSYQAHEDHKMMYEALEKSMSRDHTDQLLTDLAKARRKKIKRHDSPKTPPGSPPYQPPLPPPPAGTSRTPGASGASGASGSSQLPPPPLPLSTNQSDQSKSTAAPSSSKTAALAEYTAWTTTDSRLKPLVSSIPEDLHMDIGGSHYLRKTDLLHQNLPGPSSILTLPVPNEQLGSALASTYAPPPENSKPLPLGGLQGQVTIQSDFFFNKDLEYLRYGSKGSKPALSISKIKEDYCLDVGLEQMVPDQMWIEEECKYDVAAIGVQTHMRILSVVRIKVFSLYGYDYMKKIVLRRADLQEHIIAERDSNIPYSRGANGVLWLCENTRIVRTKMELVLEHIQQGTSNEVSEILLKMNLPDHRSVLTDPEVHVKIEMEIPRSSGVNSQPHAHT
ncbi:hypothetical protein Tco_0153621 [Tanacetum coccineum]